MPIQTFRRQLLVAAVLLVSGFPVFGASGSQKIEVWKSPTCGCCNAWIKHLEENGFTVTSNDTGNTGIRQRLGMPVKYAACHTASVSGYVIEGHVPASDIARLLREKPKALGIAVPRMPIGSPGMDGPAYRGRVDPYNVLLIQKNGSATVYESHGN